MVFRQVNVVTITVIFIIALTVSGAFYTLILSPDNPQKMTTSIVYDHLAYMKSNDIAHAYELGSTEFQYDTTYGEFSSFADRYNIFSNNIGSKIISDVIRGNTGIAKVELTGKDKEITKLEYDFIKENNAWRINDITIEPPLEDTKSLNDRFADEFNVAVPVLSGFFDNTQSRYSINFPGKWSREYMDNGTLILTGMMGTRSDYSSINIQTILTKKSGGRFTSVKNVVDDIKKQVSSMTKNSIFLESGPIELNEKSGAKAEGEYFVFSYSYDNNAYQQWDVIVSRNDGQVFYVWAYTSPINRYTDNLPLAKAILSTWKIY